MNRLLPPLSGLVLLVLPLASAACDSGGGCPEHGCLDEVSVPAGTVSMGCDPAQDDACLDDEGPPHDVTVPAFRIDRFEVTAAQYASFLNAHGSNDCADAHCVNVGDDALPVTDEGGAWAAREGLAQHPMTQVTWHGAEAFCARREQALCSEAQWVRAARGDDERLFPWGDEEPSCEAELAHIAAPHQSPDIDDLGGCGTGLTAPVGSHPKGVSPFGVHDLSGNVAEWVADPYHAGYEGAPTDGSVWAEGGQQGLRVIRGGNANDPPRHVRVTSRHDGGVNDGARFRGFRCCRWQ
ncbi:MAG: formylglycine-generating enzyme family protein [Myxococcota bacterium]